MHELIIKYFSQEISDEEKKQLFALMETDEALQNEFISVQNLHALTSWLPESQDKPTAVGKLLEFKMRLRKPKTLSFARNRFVWIAGYAASVCLAVLLTWMVCDNFQNKQLLSMSEPVEFTTPSGQRAVVKLPDGTVVWLNAHSTLRYPSHFADDERHVELNGEAYFEVKHNEDVPFIVSTEKLDIKVLGTKFNVFAYKGENEFHASLIEGLVEVSGHDDKSKLLLNPNERAELIGNQLIKTRVTDNDFLLWKDGIYSFDDVPFRDIVRKLELYYDIEIVIANKNLENYRFSGKFRQRDGVENVLKTLQKVKHFSFEKDEKTNRITIKWKK